MANKQKFTKVKDIEALDGVVKLILKNLMSYRVGAEQLRGLTGITISHEGLRKIVNKRKADGRADKEGLGSQSSELSDR